MSNKNKLKSRASFFQLVLHYFFMERRPMRTSFIFLHITQRVRCVHPIFKERIYLFILLEYLLIF